MQSYLHLCDTQGKRIAASKTAEIYGISHMTVRRYVAAHEAAQNVPEEPPDLAYIKPPGGYDPPIVPHVDIATLTEPSQTLSAESEEIMSSETCTTKAQPQENAIDIPEPSQPEPSQIHSAELETPMFATVQPSQPVMVHERIVERVRVVRLPAETHQRGLYDRLGSISLESWLGPELGILVAVVLILCTFWGLG